MSSKSYTYSETSKQKNLPYDDEPTIVKNTVTMEERNSGGVDITHFAVEKTFPDGFSKRLEWTFDSLHMCIQTQECAFWDHGELMKLDGDKFANVGLFHPLHRISVEFLRRAAQSFRDNAYMQTSETDTQLSSPSTDEEFTSASHDELDRITNSRRGRPRIYTDDEKKSKHREQSLKSYYRRKALKEHLREPANGDEVSLPVSANSKVLGNFYEEVTFKRTNGTYRKKQE